MTVTTKKVQNLTNNTGVTDTDKLVAERSGAVVTITADNLVFDGDFASNGMLARTAEGSYTAHTIAGTTNRIDVSNGDGVSGAPTIDISSSYVGQTSITTLGTISTGTWQGTTIATDQGGTGQTSYTDGQLLIGNSTGNTLAKGTITGGTNLTVTNGSGTIQLDVDDAFLSNSGDTGSGTYTFSGQVDVGDMTAENQSGSGVLYWAGGGTSGNYALKGVSGFPVIQGASTDYRIKTENDGFKITYGSGNEAYFQDTGVTISGVNVTSTTGVTVDGSTDEIQLKVQGHSTQSNNIFEVENSAGTNLFTVDNSGAGTFAADLSVNSLTAGKGSNSISTNTAFGVSALSDGSLSGTDNTAFGYQALQNLTTTNNNTAFGYQALMGDPDANNTAVGYQALGDASYVGRGAVAIGYQALVNCTTGDNNQGIGPAALQSCTSGAENCAVGTGTLISLTSANKVTAVGRSAGRGVTVGSLNTFIGTESGYGLTTGGSAITTGFGNTIIGYRADANAGDAGSCIALGREAITEASTGATSGDDGASVAIGSSGFPVGARGDDSLYPSTHGEDGYWRVKVNGTFQKIPLRPDSDSLEAFQLGSVESGITASATQTQGQQPLTNEVNEVATVGTTNDVVTLPTAVAGQSVLVINNGANTLQIFPASSDDLGAGADTSTTLAAGSNQRFTAYDATNWVQE